MAVPRLRTIVYAVTIGFTFALAAVPTRAEESGPGRNQADGRELGELRKQVAALSRRVAKLEGHLVAADLVGTYNVWDIATELIGGSPAQVITQTTAGTITLAADGTGTASLRTLGVNLTQGSPWSLVPVDSSGGGTFTWTYTDGTIQISDSSSVSVAAGGRVLIYVSRDNAHAELGIATRLQ